VQVDCQAGVGLVGSVIGGGATIARKYHASLEASVACYFPGNHAINCMCHSTENLYQMQDTAIVRASDDFYPREEASSHPHIAACAYNSLFLSPLFQPDWDMFQSKHPAAHLHACARAISGGAVYVSDKVGKHDRQILQQLVLRDGSVLRALRPGLPTEDCIFCDPLRDGETVLKVHFCGCFAGVPLLLGQVLRATSGC
jgi:raffinose synthase